MDWTRVSLSPCLLAPDDDLCTSTCKSNLDALATAGQACVSPLAANALLPALNDQRSYITVMLWLCFFPKEAGVRIQVTPLAASLQHDCLRPPCRSTR